MTAETRTRIRTLIDQHRRAHLDAYRRAHPTSYCNGCGGRLEDTSPGCQNCYDRSRKAQRAAYERKRRTERAASNAITAVRLARRRAGLCTRCCRPVHDPEPVTKQECVNCWDRQRQRLYRALRMAGT